MIRFIGPMVVVAAFVFGAFTIGRMAQARAQPTVLSMEDLSPRVWIDPPTGCEYLIETQKGITARFKPNGLPICHGEKK